MRIEDFIWLDNFVEKIAVKHGVLQDEVEQVFANVSHIRFISKGRKQRDENVYAAYGQTTGGRYLTVFFIYKKRQSCSNNQRS